MPMELFHSYWWLMSARDVPPQKRGNGVEACGHGPEYILSYSSLSHGSILGFECPISPH